jgi:hypothetical protein
VGLEVACVIICGIIAQKGSFLSIEEKKRIHHSPKEKGQTNTRSTIGEGNAEKRR